MNRRIRNILLLLAVAFLLPVAIRAQKSDLRLNVGIPLGKYGKFDHNFHGANETNYPSIVIQLEKNWRPDMSVGAYVGFAGQKQEFNLGFSEVKYAYYRFGGVFTYELNSWLSGLNISPGNDIEMYASAKIGLSLENKKSSIARLDAGNNQYTSSNTNNDVLVDLGVVIGARYHFTNTFGLFCEAGWANAGFFTLGTTFTL